MLSTCIKVPFVIKIFVLSFFEWPLKTVCKGRAASFYYIEFGSLKQSNIQPKIKHIISRCA